jgi:protein-tyrosine phosphatase
VIDFHSHILPGVDDGAESIEVSIEMLDAATAIGVRTIVATPHLVEPLSASYDAQVRDAFARVEPLAASRGIDLVRGFEIRLTPDVPARLRAGEASTLGDSDVVLVDLPGSAWPSNIDEMLFNIQASGFRPVLAHPERYSGIQKRPELGRELAGRGVALQVTIGSYSGAFGRRAQRTAESLLKVGAVHLVATDAHSAGQRMVAVPAGLKRLGALVGNDGLRQLTTATPATLLNGDALPESVGARPVRARSPLLRILTGAT